MHTLGFRELLDLLSFVCAQEPDATQPTLHVLLRYDPGPLAAVIGTYRPYFDRIRTSPTLAAASSSTPIRSGSPRPSRT